MLSSSRVGMYDDQEDGVSVIYAGSVHPELPALLDWIYPEHPASVHPGLPALLHPELPAGWG